MERGEKVKLNSTRDKTIPWNWSKNLIQARRIFQTELELIFLIQFLIPIPEANISNRRYWNKEEIKIIKQRMTQTIFKCFANLLHSSILSNQERIGLHYSLNEHFFLLILERGLHYKHKLHKLLPFDLGEGTPLQQLASTQLHHFKHTCLNCNEMNEDS